MMPPYHISHHIETFAELWESFDFQGFEFQPHAFDTVEGTQDGWLADKQIDAATPEDAFKEFSKQFFPIVDRIAFVSQCHTTAELQSFLIRKDGDTRFFFRWSRKRKTVPLHFDAKEIRSLQALETYNTAGDVFRCLREANSATTFGHMLAMLAASLEAIAGVDNCKMEQRRFIAEEILKDRELCEKIFKSRDGIRNQLLHGDEIDYNMHSNVDYNRKIYDSIVEYFNNWHSTEITTAAVGTPRTPLGTYNVHQHWYQWLGPVDELRFPSVWSVFDRNEKPQYLNMIDRPEGF